MYVGRAPLKDDSMPAVLGRGGGSGGWDVGLGCGVGMVCAFGHVLSALSQGMGMGSFADSEKMVVDCVVKDRLCAIGPPQLCEDNVKLCFLFIKSGTNRRHNKTCGTMCDLQAKSRTDPDLVAVVLRKMSQQLQEIKRLTGRGHAPTEGDIAKALKMPAKTFLQTIRTRRTLGLICDDRAFFDREVAEARGAARAARRAVRKGVASEDISEMSRQVSPSPGIIPANEGSSSAGQDAVGASIVPNHVEGDPDETGHRKPPVRACTKEQRNLFLSCSLARTCTADRHVEDYPTAALPNRGMGVSARRKLWTTFPALAEERDQWGEPGFWSDDDLDRSPTAAGELCDEEHRVHRYLDPAQSDADRRAMASQFWLHARSGVDGLHLDRAGDDHFLAQVGR